IVVTTGSAITGIDFHLGAGGTIAGRVTAPDTTPLQGVIVQIVNSAGVSVGSRTTLSDGTYSVPGLPAGTYFISTANFVGFVDEVHAWPADLPCFSCDASALGAPVSVSTGQTTSVDLTLSPGGAVSGTVSAAGGGPLAKVTVIATAPGATK